MIEVYGCPILSPYENEMRVAMTLTGAKCIDDLSIESLANFSKT